ncbi:MAG: F0F1 ATP synthase subunit B [Chloroflexi bacterium]|nr:F0F1 ATP synthase subunit B [Chloroflexota bacterium]
MAELGLDLGLILSQVVNFGLLLALLYTFLHRPILNKLRERAQRIQEGLEAADRAKVLMAEAEEHYRAEIERARREAREIIERATRAAEQQRQEILARARQDAHDLVLQAQRQAQREIEREQLAFHREVIDLALAATSRLLQEELDDEKHHELIRQFIEQANGLRT